MPIFSRSISLQIHFSTILEMVLNQPCLLTTLKTWPPEEWYLKFDIKPINIGKDWETVVLFTAGGDRDTIGAREPSILLR